MCVGYRHYRGGDGNLVINVVLVCGTECELGTESEVCRLQAEYSVGECVIILYRKGRKLL